MHYLPVCIFCSTWLGEEPLQNHQSGCGCLWSLQEISRTRDPPVSAFGIQTGCSYSTCPSRELLHSAFDLKSSPWQRKKNPMSCRFLSQKTSGLWRMNSDTNQNALVSFVQLWSLHPRRASMSYMNCEAPRCCVFFPWTHALDTNMWDSISSKYLVELQETTISELQPQNATPSPPN